jgi:hypothetical protein
VKFVFIIALFLSLTFSISPALGSPRFGFGGQIGTSSFLQLSSKVWLNSRFGLQLGWAPTRQDCSVSLKSYCKLFDLPEKFTLPIIMTHPSFSALAGRTIFPNNFFMPSNSYLGFELENGPPYAWFIQFPYAYYDAWPNFDSPNIIDPASQELIVTI